MDAFLKQSLRYQAKMLAVALGVTALAWALNPAGVAALAQLGDLNAHPTAVWVLALTPEQPWRWQALTLGAIITGVTATLMGFAARSQGVGYLAALRGHWGWGAALSLSNALSEELIFRLALLAVISPYFEPWVCVWISAATFGVAHWRGAPGGFSGIFFAGLLGWVLAKATLETHGLGIALGIHFIQDCAIIPLLLATGRRQVPGV